MAPGSAPSTASQDPSRRRAPSAGEDVGGTTPTSSTAIPPAVAPKGVKRPKWRLCFRLDRQGTAGPKSGDAPDWKHQRDFFVTVVDPPVADTSRPPAPFFASEAACQIANLLVGRPFLEQIPGRTFENKTVAVVGRDCLTAGLVAAMLGARVALACERYLLQHVQHNVRMYLRDTLDYTKTKSTLMTAVGCQPGRVGSLSGQTICEQLSAAPSLDIVVVTESALYAIAFAPDCMPDDDHEQLLAAIFSLLGELVPEKASTRILLVCDGCSSSGSGLAGDDASDCMGIVTSDDDDGLPTALSSQPGWQAKPFCRLWKRIPVVWLERQDADLMRTPSRRQPLTLRRYLPPMGASSSKCGCGGHPQKNFFNHCVHNTEWYGNHAKLKEKLLLHNRWKQGETAAVLEEARAYASGAWAANACGQQTPPRSAPPRSRGIGQSCTSSNVFDDPIDSCDLGQALDMPDLHTAIRNSASPSSGGRISGDVYQEEHSQKEFQAFSSDMEEATPLSNIPSEDEQGQAWPRARTAPPVSSVRQESPIPLVDGASNSGEPRPLPTLRTAPSSRDATTQRPPMTARHTSRRQLGYGGGGASTARGPGRPSDRSRGPTIAERHACPPHWYRCNRPCYGPPG